MIRRYSRSLRQLHTWLHDLKSDPYASNDLLLRIQELLIRRIKYVETRIREAKRCGDMELASEYQYVLYAFRAIGDGLAFTYISRWDIKALGRNHGSGFISGKSGFENEVNLMRHAIRLAPVILADLTNCLRHGDLYVFQEDRPPLVLEVKSSRGGGRSQRQMKKLRSVLDYLRTDSAEGTIIPDQLLTRISMSTEFVDHVDQANQVVSMALANGIGLISPEDGVVYVADNGTGPLKHILDRIQSLGIVQPIIISLNALKRVHDYVPMSLLLKDTEGYIQYVEGALLIMVIFDAEVVVRKFRQKTLEVQFLEEGDYFLKVGREELFIEVSKHFVGRVACEFLSLRWMIDELDFRHTTIQRHQSCS